MYLVHYYFIYYHRNFFACVLFSIDSSPTSKSVLCVHDVFVCKYEASETIEQWRERLRNKSDISVATKETPTVPQRLLPLHMDQVGRQPFLGHALC